MHPDVDQLGQEGQLGGQADADVDADADVGIIGEPATAISSLPEQGQDPVHLNLEDTYMSTDFEQQAQDPHVQHQSTDQIVHPDQGTLQTDDDLGIQIGDDLHTHPQDETHVQGDGMLIPEDMSGIEVHAVGAVYDHPPETPVEQDQTLGHVQAMHGVEETGMEQDVPEQGMLEPQPLREEGGLGQQEGQVVEQDQEHQEHVDGQHEVVDLEMHIDGDTTVTGEQDQHAPEAPVEYQEVHAEQEQLPVEEHGHAAGADQMMNEGESAYLGTEEAVVPEAEVEPILESTGIEAIAQDGSQGEVGLPVADPVTTDQTTTVPEVTPTTAAEPAPLTTGPATTGRRTISGSASGPGLKVPPHQTQNQNQGQISAQGQGEELPEALVGKSREEIEDIKRRIVDRRKSPLPPTCR